MTEAVAHGVDPEAAVRAALAHHPVLRALADVPLTVVNGGLGNHAWLAERKGQRLFVRLGAMRSAEFGIDRVSECALLHIVAAAGLAPPLVACDPAAGLLVTQFVDGAPWTAEDAGSESNLRRIGALLRRLHELPVPQRLLPVSFARQAAHLATQLATAGVPDPSDVPLRGRARNVFARLAQRAPRRTICHNDLHHLNVIDDGAHLWLVDWEYGGQGDAVFDLAGFLCQQELSELQRSAFLDAYGVIAEEEQAALEDACWAFDYVQWLWYRLWSRDRPDPGEVYARRVGRLAHRLLRCNNGALDAG
jgi:thiamine kinase-like enzyme